MRRAGVILFSVILVAGGLAFVFGRTASLAVPPMRTAATLAQEPSAVTRAPAGLACIQHALGGRRVFSAVSSLRIIGNTKPVASTGLRPVSNTREIRIVFPDRYQRLDVQTGMPRDQTPLTSLIGFNGRMLLSQPRDPDAAAAMRDARLDFVREVMMRLPRELPDVRLSQRTVLDAGKERLAIDARAQDGLAATLLADSGTCVPVALQYRSSTGLLASRIDLSDYRPFGGIRFPTALRTARNGQPWIDERDSDVRVNASGAEKFFGR